MKTIYKLLVFSCILVLILITIASLYKPLSNYLIFLIPLFYWLITFVLIAALKIKKLSYRKIFRTSLILVIIGALLATIGQSRAAEGVLKLAFIGLVISLINSIKEYLADDVK